MQTIKEPKNIEVLVNIKYEDTENETLQKFIFNVSNKKHLHYLFDARYLFKTKIDKLIKELILDDFKKRVDSEEEIVMIYSKQNHPKPCIRKIQAYIPPFAGCEYCSKAQFEGLFVYCPEKNKHFSKAGGIKRCPGFRTKEEIIT